MPVKATHIEITLELEDDGDTVSGRARTADGEVREFSGWIGLMGLVDSLLERARTRASNHAETTEERKDGHHSD